MTVQYKLSQLLLYFLKLGTIGFGGPVALVGYMHRDLVQERQWLSEDDYKEGLALSQLAPGPLAAQLSIYIGYVHYGIKGATLTGIVFVLPSFLMVLGISYAYVIAGGLPWMQAIFYGIGAAVIGIISVSSFKLTKKSLGSDRILWVIFMTLAVITFITEREIIILIIIAGIAVWLNRMKFGKLLSVNLSLSIIFFLQVMNVSWTDVKLKQIGWYFFKAGAFVFGSGLAIVPFLYGGVVKEFGWLSEQEFLDAMAVAMITPGPVVITVAFIGYLVAGFKGACIAALATFLPCYLFTVIPAPYFRKYGKHPGIKAFVDGITAAAIGSIAGAVLVLAKRQLTDFLSISIALITIALLLKFKKLPEPLIILIAALAGLFIKLVF